MGGRRSTDNDLSWKQRRRSFPVLMLALLALFRRVTQERTLDPFKESAEELSPRDGYAAWAACYEDDGNPLIPLEGPAMAALFGPVAGSRVLDLGCGTGRHTLALAEAGALVTALDQSPEMMALARRKLQGHPVEWVLHALPAPLPFPDEAFALVVAGLVVEHVADLPAL